MNIADLEEGKIDRLFSLNTEIEIALIDVKRAKQHLETLEEERKKLEGRF